MVLCEVALFVFVRWPFVEFERFGLFFILCGRDALLFVLFFLIYFLCCFVNALFVCFCYEFLYFCVLTLSCLFYIFLLSVEFFYIALCFIIC